MSAMGWWDDKTTVQALARAARLRSRPVARALTTFSAALSLLMLLTAPAASAAPEGTVAARPSSGCVESVAIEVSAVLARKGSGKLRIDPALSSLRPLLKKAFPDYTDFSLLSTTATRVDMGKVEQVALPNGASLRLSYKGMDDTHIKLDLSIPPRLSTSVRVPDGGTFFQAGMSHDNGTLIVAITARTP